MERKERGKENEKGVGMEEENKKFRRQRRKRELNGLREEDSGKGEIEMSLLGNERMIREGDEEKRKRKNK